MRKPIYEEALQYLKETGKDFANGPSNDVAIELIETLYELGSNKIYVGLYDDPYRDDDGFDAELFLDLNQSISVDLMVEIVSSHPDEISQEDDSLIRLWWD